MIRTVIAFLFALNMTSANSQVRYSISGKVLNEANKQPVSNATVGLSIGNLVQQSTTTKTDGTYIFNVSKLGPFIIIVSKDGFEIFTTPEFPLETGKFDYRLNLINLSAIQKAATQHPLASAPTGRVATT